ncbi:hypothetical protein [Sphingomonas albertensis]|uniref:Uncharacterized protein n=1 Tax=Sphingomonas albertensis TaxID=2762591 RepID=A0ABR7ASB0_9SPHN|nr:hypothetical protein [Sphingomonas albertensis]MBC3943344.1 hypothetical protein [Sphingomonas albertensis]
MTQNPTTNTEAGSVADVAAKLTEAQRAVVLGAIETPDGPHRDTRWRCQNAGRVKKRLLDLGLVYLVIPMFSWRSDVRDVILTPLGLAVRQHLEQGATAGGVGGKERGDG